MTASADTARWAPKWTLQKYHEDIEEFRRQWGKAEGERRFYEQCQPYETKVIDGNVLVNTGIQLLLDLLRAAGGTAFNNANAHIGVGNSATAAAATDTDLIGASKLRKAMDATFPTRTNQTITFKSSFGSSEANFAWAEWGVFNAAAAGTMLNRKVEALGTKTTGTWTLQADITIS